MEKNILLIIGLSVCVCITVVVSLFAIYAPEKINAALFASFILLICGCFLGVLVWYPKRIKVLYVPDSEKIEHLEKGQVSPSEGILITKLYFDKLLRARDYAVSHGFMRD